MASNKQKMLEKFGSEEKYKEYMRDLAAKGGKRKVPKGRYYKSA